MILRPTTTLGRPLPAMGPPFVVALVLCLGASTPPLPPPASPVRIPVAGNSWIVNGGPGDRITRNGAERWATVGSTVRTYFRVARPGTLLLSVVLVGPGAESELAVSVGATRRTLRVSGDEERQYDAGTFTVDSAGYVAVDLTGVSRKGDTFGRPVAIDVAGTAVTPGMSYVPNDEGNMFHFGRRGPSTHLRWNAPEGGIRWMYSEITVPAGDDVVGSYFMANGFDGGYFGMQVNGPDRRVFLFSVWSPYKTDDPSAVPADYKVATLGHGDGVLVGEFGNEGTGGQSRMPFAWKADTTYRFLTEVSPTGDGATDVAAWVYLPEAGGWHLMARFRRPHTDTYAKSPYSFLENFVPDTGNETRMAYYHDQWVADPSGRWRQVVDLTMTVDATARQGFRRDYAAGISRGWPFIRIDGFFDDPVAPGTVFHRPPSAHPPEVAFEELPSGP